MEELPSRCPPEDAIQKEMVVYRAVTSFPPSEADFYSQRRMFPKKPFNIDDCLAHACSVFDNEFDIKKKKKLLSHNGIRIVKFKIELEDGKVKKTFSKGHHSWWICKSCHISSKSYEEINE